MFLRKQVPERLRGSYSDWLSRRKQLAPGALPAGYQDDKRRQELRQQLERELKTILDRLESFSGQAIAAVAKGEEFYPLLGELIGKLQDIQQEQAESKGNRRRLVDLVREKMAAGQNQDDFTRQLALVRARPVKRKRAKSLAGLVVKHAGVEELHDLIKTLRAA